MRYKNTVCTACGKTFTEEDDVVVCPVCGAPHHRACWMETGRCAMNDAHAEGYVWKFPQQPEGAKEETAAQNPAGERPLAQMKNGEKVVPCPRCGRPNFANDIYCMKCGAKMDGSDADDDYYEDDERSYEEEMNSFREMRGDYERFGGISPEASVDGIPCAEYSDFVGGSRPGRIIRKVSIMERYGKKLSWMWPALFFGPAWYFWRKMKTEGTVFALLLVFLAAFAGLIGLDAPAVQYYKQVASLASEAMTGSLSINEYRERASEYMQAYMEKETEVPRGRAILEITAEYCLLGALPLCSCLLSVGLYRKHVKNKIHAIRGRCHDMEEYRLALQTEGGTSAAGAIVGVLVLIAAIFCALYLPMIIAVFVI